MEVGIVGLPRVGKTTLFNALTGGHAEAFSDKAHVGIASIPDPRLDLIARTVNVQKTVHAPIKLVDIHGVAVRGDPKKLSQALEKIRTVDAVCHVVRCFDDGTGRIHPAADIQTMQTELVLADLIVAEAGAQKAEKPSRAGDEDAHARLELLHRIIPILEDGASIHAARDFAEHERLILKNFGFITAKPVLYVANVPEDDLHAESSHARAVLQFAESAAGRSVAICAQLEAELAELDEPDRSEMLQSLGLTEPAVGPLARAAHAVLGLETFYTFNNKEVRAWAFPLGASAPQAAGIVHTDMQRGFIRAECYNVKDLAQHKSEKALREAGLIRSEGKHYQLKDGDVVKFLFNV